ncbi:hypothetical protein BDY17DRAFT_10554 [Neohortaea acidophila]|uniref:Uncharacterized protein n=1 Tax=Neohortaea acidophila TaxID=245834 RepID=A0A6A6Q5S3_9PEZI|nr:uncharacterized protein BDY17DRAFT_10554 [Neohortaea acidophila]KAF2487389.1 hypothetical protein BDY17DRAFT_10554 [Neohortaea acidophila]
MPVASETGGHHLPSSFQSVAGTSVPGFFAVSAALRTPCTPPTVASLTSPVLPFWLFFPRFHASVNSSRSSLASCRNLGVTGSFARRPSISSQMAMASSRRTKLSEIFTTPDRSKSVLMQA